MMCFSVFGAFTSNWACDELFIGSILQNTLFRCFAMHVIFCRRFYHRMSWLLLRLGRMLETWSRIKRENGTKETTCKKVTGALKNAPTDRATLEINSKMSMTNRRDKFGRCTNKFIHGVCDMCVRWLQLNWSNINVMENFCRYFV